MECTVKSAIEYYQVILKIAAIRLVDKSINYDQSN
jgi:hypothetical protein